MPAKPFHRGAVAAASMALSAMLSAMAAMPAHAAPSSELKAEQEQLKTELVDLQEQLEKASDDYTRTLSEKESAERVAEADKADIAANDEKLGELRERLGERSREMYKSNVLETFTDVFFGSSSLQEVIAGWNAMLAVNQKDAEMVGETRRLNADSAAKAAEAAEHEMVAAQLAEQAEGIRAEAEAKVAEYEGKIADLDDEIKEAMEREAAAEMAARSASASGGSSGATAGAAAGIPANGSVVDYARSRLGCPYVWAASGPSSFDCSGLVMWCYAQAGKSLPHNSEAQYSVAKAVIPISEAQPGDVLYMSGHVGIYIGGGQYIHAPTPGDVVKVSSWPMFTCALRF